MLANSAVWIASVKSAFVQMWEVPTTAFVGFCLRLDLTDNSSTTPWHGVFL
jgi:hypothetical protein